jgi:hypothetical protein
VANTGITGKLVDPTGAPVAGLTVQAYDVDVLSDDLLGSATTTITGEFSVSYTSASYGSESPDLKLVILDPAGVLVRDTPEYPDVTDPTLHIGNIQVSGAALLAGSLPGGPGFRGCCVIGFSPVFDPSSSTTHVFGGGGSEAVGYVYTCAAGFLDLGHVRDVADLTYYYFKNLAKRLDHDKALVPRGKHFAPWSYDGDVEILLDVPDAQLLDVARSMAYDHSIFYEIYSYWVQTPGMHNSAFSPEDLVSNWLGTYIAGRAIRAGGTFDVELARELNALLTVLHALPVADTAAAQAAVTAPAGTWFSRVLPRWDFLRMDLLRRRNFVVRPATPWLIPGFGPCSGSVAALPPWDLPASLRGFYDMTLEVGFPISSAVSPSTMQSSEFQESGPHITKIKTDALRRYGANFATQ